MDLELLFPNLLNGGHRVTSPHTLIYNCIAWAAGIVNDWWWPDPELDHYWPDGIPRLVTCDAFSALFESLGYSVCPSPDFEEGFEKVAIFALDGQPKHAARQLASGWWTSKLGKYVDIEHTLHGLEGAIYGTAAIILKRPAATS